jgi:hypothetical protein
MTRTFLSVAKSTPHERQSASGRRGSAQQLPHSYLALVARYDFGAAPGDSCRTPGPQTLVRGPWAKAASASVGGPLGQPLLAKENSGLYIDSNDLQLGFAAHTSHVKNGCDRLASVWRHKVLILKAIRELPRLCPA